MSDGQKNKELANLKCSRLKNLPLAIPHLVLRYLQETRDADLRKMRKLKIVSDHVIHKLLNDNFVCPLMPLAT